MMLNRAVVFIVFEVLVAATTFTTPTSAQLQPDNAPISWDEPEVVMVEYVGSVPAVNTGLQSYNMMVMENFDNDLFFIDQKEGIIYKSQSGDVMNRGQAPPEKIFDIDTDAPKGLDFDYAGSASSQSYIAAMAPGKSHDEVYVVFTSLSFPPGLSSALALPEPYIDYVCSPPSALGKVDLFRIPPFTECLVSPGRTVYRVFYKFNLEEDGQGRFHLTNPQPFFALENQFGNAHLGGGILSLRDGRMLYGVGDCLPWGTNGLETSQSVEEHCGNILLIDAEQMTHEVAAIGVRNTQQINLSDDGKKVVFMDIGSFISEEVNAVDLNDLLNTTEVENFGWGIDPNGLAREGIYHVGRGRAGFGIYPPYEGDAPVPEDGFIQPWAEFGRGPELRHFGISGSVTSNDLSFRKIKLAMTEFNLGVLLVTKEEHVSGSAPAQVYNVPMIDEKGDVLTSFKALVSQKLNLTDSENARGDFRAFRYPDGTAGVFIERTGDFFRLTEVVHSNR